MPTDVVEVDVTDSGTLRAALARSELLRYELAAREPCARFTPRSTPSRLGTRGPNRCARDGSPATGRAVMSAQTCSTPTWQPTQSQRRALESVMLAHEFGRGPHLATDHLEDLRRSGLTDETIVAQRIVTVPPGLIAPLLGYDPPAVRSAYLLASPGFPDDFYRLKIFPAYKDRCGSTVKYLQPPRSGIRLFRPVSSRDAVRDASAPLWIIEGEKKALAGAQLWLAAIGILGVEGWHLAGQMTLHPDFDDIPLRGRRVELALDGDIQHNPNVRRAAARLAHALRMRGARPRLVMLPDGGQQ